MFMSGSRYCANCRLGKARPNPRDDDNGGRFYPLSPQINPPLALLKVKSNTRGESRVTLGKWEEKWDDGNDAPIGQVTRWKSGLIMSLGGSQWFPRSSSTRSIFLYMPGTQEKTRYKANNPMDKQVKLVVPICNNQQRYIYQQKKDC